MTLSQLRQHLESLAAAGVLGVPRPLDACGEPERPAHADTRGSSANAVHASPPVIPRSSGFQPLAGIDEEALVSRWTALNAIKAEVVACTRCQQLACSRKQTVFGAGHAAARICFLGEAPGAEEDASGEPFVGRAGQLLTKIIEACRLTRDEVFILNVLKCRPPDNRRPTADEVENCRPFFQRQLEIISPDVICCLGATAAQALLGVDTAIGKLRGQWHRYRNADVTCTYHPSYLLRNPAAKREVWEDMKAMMRRLGVEL